MPLDILPSEKRKLSKEESSRYLVHPLLQYDPDAAKWIKVIRAEYFDECKAPVPRRQDLPAHAFGELTGRTILAATSHAWFWQSHPDPEGVKLKLLRDEFIPRLRKRYPETKIVIFDDWHSCPQWPRTKKEDEIFYKAMDHMNSMYVYCDVVLFLEAKLPDLDMTVRTCSLIPANYSFGRFVDVTQFHGPESSSLDIRKNDIITKPCNIDILKSTTNETEISYLKRSFGRPNRIPASERGWLYAERITIAVKVATAGQHRFDDIVWSNSEQLRTTIYTWARVLLVAAKRGKISKALENYTDELNTKRFTCPSDSSLVKELVESLVKKFSSQWEEETERQTSMSVRTREILLRWGEFSNEYVKEARLLKQKNEESGWMWWSLGKVVGLSILGPTIAMLPFVLKVTDDCVESLVGHSVWLGVVGSVPAILATPVLNYAFLSVSVGWHTLRYFLYSAVVHSCLTFLLRLASSDRVPPFLFIYFVISSVIFSRGFVFKISFFKHRDERDGQVETYGIEPYLKYPKAMRHNRKLENEAKYIQGLGIAGFVFGLLYPILGGIFFQADIVLQACLIPVFFALRTWFEYQADAKIAITYGSDKLPFVSFLGVMMHEICLSVMITSIKHPLVFVALILADVFENAFCLWSLSRSKASRSSTVEPIEEDDTSTLTKSTHVKRSFARRSSSVYSLAKDLRELKDESSEGTALFIAAILLQREMCETIVPIQGIFVMSVLYASDVKSNSMVSQWSSRDDYIQALTYLGIDLGVELIVFVGTVLVLRRIYPKFSAFRIMMGLVRSNSELMLAQTIAVWMAVLMFQNTLSGLDLTLKFEWLDCDGENATWVSGFDWDNC